MKLAGFLLLLAGWGLVLSAIVLLKPSPALVWFVVAGLGVEMLGMALVFRSHIILKGNRS